MENLHGFWHVGTPIWKLGTPSGTLACQIKTLSCRMAHWHVYWHTFGMLARRPVNHAGTQARWHMNRTGTLARMACDLANSFDNEIFQDFLTLKGKIRYLQIKSFIMHFPDKIYSFKVNKRIIRIMCEIYSESIIKT